ncbi:response regulator transcription factor [Nitrospira sp. Nam74]
MVAEYLRTMRVKSGPTGAISRLLLVDDDPALLDALSGTLQSRFGHFSLDTCDCGARALNLAKREKYDTIIVDVNMPNMV